MAKSLKKYLMEWKHIAHSMDKVESVFSQEAIAEDEEKDINIAMEITTKNREDGKNIYKLKHSIHMDSGCKKISIKGQEFDITIENQRFVKAAEKLLKDTEEEIEEKTHLLPSHILAELYNNCSTTLALLFIYGIYYDNETALTSAAESLASLNKKLGVRYRLPQKIFETPYGLTRSSYNICKIAMEVGDIENDIIEKVKNDSFAYKVSTRSYLFETAIKFDTALLSRAFKHAIKGDGCDKTTKGIYRPFGGDVVYDTIVVNAILKDVPLNTLKETIQAFSDNGFAPNLYLSGYAVTLSIQKGRRDIAEYIMDKWKISPYKVLCGVMPRAKTKIALKKNGGVILQADEKVLDFLIARGYIENTTEEHFRKNYVSKCALVIPDDIRCYFSWYMYIAAPLDIVEFSKLRAENTKEETNQFLYK